MKHTCDECLATLFSFLFFFPLSSQARAHVDAVCTVRSITTLYIVNRTRANGEKLAAYARTSPSTHGRLEQIIVLEAPDRACVQNAHVICTTTNASKPLFDGTWLNQERGTHLNAVGSYTPSMQEIDVDTVARCAVIVDTPHALSCGDLAMARRERNVVEKTHGLIELGSALKNECSTLERREKWLSSLESERRSERSGGGGGGGGNERVHCTLFKSVGTSVQDISTAGEVVRRARAMNIGRVIGM